MLHSAFWVHGAGELDLPPWWTQIFRKLKDKEETARSRDGSGLVDGLFLDFLYPRKTVAFIQQCSAYGVERWESRLYSPASIVKGRRTYTSVATEDEENDADEATSRTQTQTQWADDGPFQLLTHLLHENDMEQSGKAWRLYSQCGNDEKKSIRLALLGYLAHSDKIEDAKDLIEVFKTISISERKGAVFRYAIAACLKLSDSNQAKVIHSEAHSDGLEGTEGSDILLAHFIDAERWEDARQLWSLIRNGRKRYENISWLWNATKTMQTRLDRALALDEFAREYLGCSENSESEKSDFKSFATDVFMVALSLPKGSRFDAKKFFTLYSTLREWGRDHFRLYERSIAQLLYMREDKAAIKVYEDYRQHCIWRPTADILYLILTRFCHIHSFRGIQTIWDDWCRFHGLPTAEAYLRVLREYSNQGAVELVEDMFKKYVANFGPPRDTEAVIPLLQVHAKRGNVKLVVQRFHELKSLHGLQPDVKCWTVLINAHARVGDIDSALECFEDMRKSNVKPDSLVISIMMGMSAARGDLAATQEFYSLCKSQDITPTALMIDYLVLAHIRNGDLVEAERLCDEALAMDVGHPKTKMWNLLLNAYALRRDVQSVNRISQRMQDEHVHADGNTFAALIHVLVLTRQPDLANKILMKILPRTKIKATPYHYALVMGGYYGLGDVEKVFQVFSVMIERGVKPYIGTQIALLKASVAADLQELGQGEQLTELKRAERILDHTLKMVGPVAVAGRLPMVGTHPQAPATAYPALYFDFLTHVYGRERAFRKVEEMYSRYQAAEQDVRPGEDDKPALRMVSAMMAASLQKKDHAEVARFWDVAMSIARREASTILRARDSPARDNWVLYARRYILSVHLVTYMASLRAQGRLAELHRLVAEHQRAGFALDRRNWNEFISHLASLDDTVQAFNLCELHLMSNWNDWRKQRKLAGTSVRVPAAVRRESMRPDVLRPTYHTFLYLAAAMARLKERALESRHALEQVREIEMQAPRATRAVYSMPTSGTDLERGIMNG
jgi:pentatricopeptide repeat-containing protein PET309